MIFAGQLMVQYHSHAAAAGSVDRGDTIASRHIAEQHAATGVI